MSGYPVMPGVPAAGHVSRGGHYHPGPAHHCTKCDPQPPPGTEAGALWYLQRELSYGMAADFVIADARRQPGWTAYTPDGCAWVVTSGRPARWAYGRASRAEQHLAHDRRTVVRTRVDPDAIGPGHEIAWTGPDGVGTVEYTTAEGVHVLADGGYLVPDRKHRYAIEWTRVTGHWINDLEDPR